MNRPGLQNYTSRSVKHYPTSEPKVKSELIVKKKIIGRPSKKLNSARRQNMINRRNIKRQRKSIEKFELSDSSDGTNMTHDNFNFRAEYKNQEGFHSDDDSLDVVDRMNQSLYKNKNQNEWKDKQIAKRDRFEFGSKQTLAEIIENQSSSSSYSENQNLGKHTVRPTSRSTSRKTDRQYKTQYNPYQSTEEEEISEILKNEFGSPTYHNIGLLWDFTKGYILEENNPNEEEEESTSHNLWSLEQIDNLIDFITDIVNSRIQEESQISFRRVVQYHTIRTLLTNDIVASSWIQEDLDEILDYITNEIGQDISEENEYYNNDHATFLNEEVVDNSYELLEITRSSSESELTESTVSSETDLH
jgi:hypothetical protein